MSKHGLLKVARPKILCLWWKNLNCSKRQRKRFPVACYYLSRELGIEDGYKAIWIAEDREQLKGREKSGGEILSNLQFTRRYIRGKHIVLLDDVLTTGINFLHLSRKMKELGAVSVTGVFLGKTVGGGKATRL